MPVQQQMSSFAKKLGGRLAQANAQCYDKPPDLTPKKLPAGIRNGIARLSAMYTKTQDSDDGVCPKGEVFFRASAIVVSPQYLNGEKVEGVVTQEIVPLCDIPERVYEGGGIRAAIPFEANWNKVRSIIESLGISPFPEPPIDYKRDPQGALAQGERIERYYMAAMVALTDPKRPRVYVSFSTRGFTPPKTAKRPNPEEIVTSYWHGLAQWNGQPDPVVSVQDSTPPSVAPPTPVQPPFNEFAPPPPQAPEPTVNLDKLDSADEVAALIETAMGDPEGATDEGTEAAARLEKLAWEKGWTQEQTKNALDWAQVGEMAISAPTAPPSQHVVDTHQPAPKVGSKWKFAKRTKDGIKLRNNKGEEFPPQEVEVVSVDVFARVCTVKSVKDGKPVVDIRSKQPIQVKFEWLE